MVYLAASMWGTSALRPLSNLYDDKVSLQLVVKFFLILTKMLDLISQDSVIFERLRGNQPIVKVLELQLEGFAHLGLRTLCLAEKVLSHNDWAAWNKK